MLKMPFKIVRILSLAWLLPFFTIPAQAQEMRVTDFLNRAKALEVRGEWVSALGAYTEAIEAAREVLMHRIQRLGDDHPDVAAYLDRVADLYLMRCEFMEKIDQEGERETNELCDFVVMYERAEWIRTKAYATPFHPEIAKTLDRAAQLWRRCHPPMAEKFYKAAVSCKENIFGPIHPEVADACDRYAYYLRCSMMKFKAARSLYERALSIRETTFGKNHPKTIRNLPDLAWTTFYSGDKAYAKSVIQRAVSTVQGEMKPDPEVADILARMGILLDETGDAGGARILLTRAADIRKRIFGYRSPEVADTLADLGLVFRNRNEPDQALRYYEEALDILKNIYGPEHPELGEVMLELIGVLEDMGEKERAKKLNERLERIRIKKNS